MLSLKTLLLTSSHSQTYTHVQSIMTRCFRFLFALAWKAAIIFPYLFSFGTLAAGLQIRVDIDIN
ncbi:hypothetical protein I4U23_021060 [Adineta vaga]|nr:hypothetical protein I4U23_021060 [Adineta vaga]